MDAPRVTIVVVPRDHFSDTRESLESIFAHTEIPFKLVYVDGGSPRHVQQYIESMARIKHFNVIRTDHYLSPNHARNIGLRELTTTYVVFMDNDAVVAPGWLQPLVECADETGAVVVSPLNCERKPLHQTIHFAGGEASVQPIRSANPMGRHIIDKIYLSGQPLETMHNSLKREPTGAAEFHCMLVRSSIFDKIGPFDEAMLSTRENLDFCMKVKEADGSVYFEPRSIITYLPPAPLHWSDVPFFLLRWSDGWDLSSFQRFRDKWNLVEDHYFQREYKNLGWRRKEIFIKGTLLWWIPSWKVRIYLTNRLAPLEKALNRFVSKRYQRSRSQG
jgi:GT2 family glycosyltransferase